MFRSVLLMKIRNYISKRKKVGGGLEKEEGRKGKKKERKRSS